MDCGLVVKDQNGPALATPNGAADFVEMGDENPVLPCADLFLQPNTTWRRYIW
jgi:hypothetical protein